MTNGQTAVMTTTPATDLSSSSSPRPEIRRPQLRSGLPILRRPGSVQLGWDNTDAVVLDPGSGALADWLRLLDGSRGRPELHRAAHRLGLAVADAAAVLDLLDRRGLLEPAEPPPTSTGYVRLIGAGRVGRAVAELLVTADLAILEVVDDEPVDRALYPRRLASGRQSAALEAELRAVRSADRPGPTIYTDDSRRAGGELSRARLPGRRWATEPSADRRPDATVVASDRLEVDRMITDALLRDDQPHLIVRAAGNGVVVGPFVLPGRTACVRCTDLARAERDPDWPGLLSQLTRITGDVPGTLLSWAAATAAGQLLVLLAGGGEPPESAGRTLELDRDHRRQTRRWSVHPGCGCSWSAGALLVG